MNAAPLQPELGRFEEGEFESMVGGLIVERFVNGLVEVIGVFGNEVRQVGVLGVAPHRLDRVEFGAIGGQLLELDALPAKLGDPLFRRAVHAPAVPHDDERATNLVPQAA